MSGGKKSAADIVFLSVFCICLFIPALKISKEDISAAENRKLAVFKPLYTKEKGFNNHFGQNFDSWFNGRFYLRLFLIKLDAAIDILFTQKTKKAAIDFKTGIIYDYANNFNEFPINKIKENFDALYKFQDFCEKNNIKLYTVIVPLKYIIHPHSSLSEDYKRQHHEEFLELIKSINEEKKLKIIYPYYELLDGKKDGFMFFKTEHHWTDDAAFICYKLLMKEIKKDYPDINVLDKDDFEYLYSRKVRGDWDRNFAPGASFTYSSVPDFLADTLHDIEYKYYKHKNSIKLKETVIDTELHKEKFYTYPDGADLKVILLGTSQSENLTEFIPFTFKNTIRIKNNAVKGIPVQNEFKIFKYYKDEILESRPDIIIFCISYINIPELHHLAEER